MRATTSTDVKNNAMQFESSGGVPVQLLPYWPYLQPQMSNTSCHILSQILDLGNLLYKSTTENAAKPKILVWAKQMHCIGYTLPPLPNGDGGCDVTFDRAEYEQSDAVVFFMKCCFSSDLPDQKLRRPEQVFVWWAQESAWTVKHYYHQSLTEFNNYFNWTMTYRRGSDVLAAMWPVSSMDYLFMNLGRKDDMVDPNLEERPLLTLEQYQQEAMHLLSLKTKFVSWIATNCKSTRGAERRLKVVDSLEKEAGIEIDKFGKCGKKPIPLNNTVLFTMLAPYKFYLAFENSYHCQDYISEKTTYNSFVAGAVPIIFGPSRDDAAKLLPKHSYVHVEDFGSIENLGKYLKHLDGNDTAYLEYFNWWKEPGAQTFPRFGFNYGMKYVADSPSYRHLEKYELQDDWQDLERFGLYHLCRKLKKKHHLKTSKTIPHLANWFYQNESRECYV